MEIKKIVVCGDSFCSADKNRPGSHFSELLIGYEVINLARGGITNTAICFQIEKAVELNADFVIFSNTSADRLDIPLNPFNPSLGLQNFIYPYESDRSTESPHVGNLTANIYSDTIPTLLAPRPDLPIQLSQELDKKKEAIKHYISELHDTNLRHKTDEWMLGYWMSIMEAKDIKFLHINKSPIWRPIADYVSNNKDKLNQCVYHTDEHIQKIIAISLKEYVDKMPS